LVKKAFEVVAAVKMLSEKKVSRVQSVELVSRDRHHSQVEDKVKRI